MGVRAHRTPGTSMRVLGEDTCPPPMASTFLVMFPETEEIWSLVPLLICLATLQAREHRPVGTHTEGKEVSPPSSWFQFLPWASHYRGQSP